MDDTTGNVGIGTTTPSAALNVVGASSSVAIDTAATGDASVVLSSDAISSSETLDEPGVASENGSAFTLNGGIETILSQTITVPADGFVLAIASCQANALHVNGTTDNADFAVSDTAGVIPGTQDVAFLVDQNHPTGNILVPVTVQAIFRRLGRRERVVLPWRREWRQCDRERHDALAGLLPHVIRHGRGPVAGSHA